MPEARILCKYKNIILVSSSLPAGSCCFRLLLLLAANNSDAEGMIGARLARQFAGGDKSDDAAQRAALRLLVENGNHSFNFNFKLFGDFSLVCCRPWTVWAASSGSHGQAASHRLRRSPAALGGVIIRKEKRQKNAYKN